MKKTPPPTKNATAPKRPVDKEKAIDDLSKAAALTFVLARAFNLWNHKLEQKASKLQQVHTYETKHALSQIIDGCQKISKGLEHFEDWAIASGITESGHCGDQVAVDSYLTDGAWLAYLAGATFNAAAYDSSIRLTIESLCKVKTTGTPLLKWEGLNSLRPQ